MRRALIAAARAPFTSPNPKVGAVVVRDGDVVAEGHHEGAGTAHAEVASLAGVDADGADLYVTLEPCVHEGRTPPCAPLVAEAGVRRVVIAALDPDERVAGRGVKFLRSRGIDVEVGLLEADARTTNAPFFHHRTTGRPLVTLKMALTLDGRLAAVDGSSQWITGPQARRLVHARRAGVDGILVGAGTIASDDPSMTARDVGATRQPAKIVVDSRGRIAPSARVFSGPGPLLIATSPECPHEVQTSWKEAGAEVLVLERDKDGVSLTGLFEDLGRRGFLEVYCEGGGRLATSLLAERPLVDRLELFYGGVIAGAGGPDIGNVGVATLGDAQRWTTRAVAGVGDDVFVTLHSPALVSLLQPAGERT